MAKQNAFLFSLLLTISAIVPYPLRSAEPQAHELASIDTALNLILPITDAGDLMAASVRADQAVKHVWDGEYAAALAAILNAIEQFPRNFYVQARLASIVGDYAEMFSGELKERMINRSKAIFEKLNGELEGQSIPDYFFFKNEYCFRFALYKEQYELGFEKLAYYVKTDDADRAKRIAFSYYTQGVGAANYAKQLLLKGEQPLAHAYAEKALVAWAQHFSLRNDYYNSYVHYGLALGILGYKEKMMHALIHAANLINKDLSFHEFKEVIDFIEQRSSGV